MNHISPSQINMYLRCPAQYYFRYVEGLILPPRAAMTRGTAVHRGIEANYRQKIESHEDMSLTEVQDITAAIFDELAENTEWDEDRGKTKDAAIQLIGVYHEELAPTVQPAYIEQRVEIPLEGTDRTLLGFIDLIDAQDNIRDTKTTKRTPPANTIDKNLQLTAYALAYRTLTGKEEAGVKLDYLIHSKTPKTVTLEAKRTEDDILRFLGITQGIIRGIEGDVFYPNPDNYLCNEKWCGYWNECHKTF